MTKRLAVHIFASESVGSPTQSFGPGSEIPDWLAEQIEGQDHLFHSAEAITYSVTPKPSEVKTVEVEHPVTGASQSREPAATDEGKSDLIDVEDDEDEDSVEDEDDEDEAPKRNASELDWREFAESKSVVLNERMGRDDVIKACEDAGLIEPKA